MMANVDLTENVVDTGWFRRRLVVGLPLLPTTARACASRQNHTNIPNSTGNGVRREDDFGTENAFYGGDFGFRTHFVWENFTLGL